MLTWIVETDLNEAADRVAAAAREAGHRVVRWSTGDDVPAPDGPCVFVGSLTECGRMPGVVGDPEKLRVGSWLPILKDVALNSEVVESTVEKVAGLGLSWPRVFARPDSAMKPFAGRVLDTDKLSPGALDHGFYYDDPALPVVLAEAVGVEEEWRFVSVDRSIVAWSGYEADGRTGREATPPEDARLLAEDVARRSPEPTVVIDVARTDQGQVRLVELNLFSGADLYACDAAKIVDAVAAARQLGGAEG